MHRRVLVTWKQCSLSRAAPKYIQLLLLLLGVCGRCLRCLRPNAGAGKLVSLLACSYCLSTCRFFFLFLADEQLILLSGSWAERETAGGFSR